MDKMDQDLVKAALQEHTGDAIRVELEGDLLSEEERHRLLVEWNDTSRDYPQEQCIHELFETQAARTPEATAVVFKEERVSYRELNERANRLGRYLVAQGVTPASYVAICMERSAEMVVALLATLKAGGAYVPLDSQLPTERQAFILADCGAKIVISGKDGSKNFPGLNVNWVDLRRDAHAIECCHHSNLGIHVGGDALAYVMYTSGSTGVPKGVVVAHRGVNRLVVNNYYASIEDSDCIAHCSNPAFDASTFEVWGALLNGARLLIVAQPAVLDPKLFRLALIHNHVTVLWLTSALLNQYADALGSVLTQLKYLLVGGESLDAKVIRRILRANPPENLINGYGPTECTTFASTYRIDSVAEDAKSIPIGRPIANTRIYILDEHRQPVPIGVVGEIYIGGPGVARGYLNRPELTEERFIASPFVASDRLYRTGDLARWLPEGVIEFLGRNDHQVKIRGFRIELGEVEARLNECPGVLEAVVVVAGEDSPGDKHLVAYLRTQGGTRLDIEKLRAYLGAVLPEYMVPAAYVTLEKFPLTANGKLNRGGLPAPEADAYVRREYEAPEGEVETRLAQIWAEVLKQERVGRYDNFFELGGHSLRAVTLISRVRSALGVEIGVKDVFACPVLEGMAQIVARAERSEQIVLQPVSRTAALPLSYAQQRLWFLAQMAGGSEAYHIPLGLRLTGDMNRDALKRALDRIVWRHEALRTCFERFGEETVQRIGPPESGFALKEDEEEHDLRECKEAAWELERRMGEEAKRAFDVEHGPMVRGQLIRVGDQEHVLLITMHHIASDGWSMEVLTRELSALYRAYRAGEQDPLPPLPIQYADYAVWQRAWLTGEVLNRQSEYWRQALEGAPALLELPTDRPRPARQSFAGNMLPVDLDKELAWGLKALGRRHGATLYMTLLAGWAVVLSRLSGQQEVVIGTPVANRGRMEIEGLIGFFVNTLALRVATLGSVAELLERVKEHVLEAQEHQDLPFEQVVELMKVPRSLSHTPIFQAMLAWQNNEEGCLDLPGLTVSPVKIPYDAVKFDVELELSEAGEQISGGLRYATALFDSSTMERHAGYLGRVLEAMVFDEQVEVESIDLLSEAERHQLLVEWNDTRREYPQDQCIHELFESQVERTPEAIALVHEGCRLTYGELNRQANRLGHRLRKMGVGADTRVAICAEQGMEMVIGMLAILKAGAAYVPLDPAYPSERLIYMLKDSAPQAVLVQTGGRPVIATGEIPVLDLKAGAPAWENEPGTNPVHDSIGPALRRLAYIIYTSGSTGLPKGVMVEHSHVVNLIRTHVDNCTLTARDNVLQFDSISFDASVEEIFTPLTVGAKVVLRPASMFAPDEEYLRLLHDERITVAELPTAFWRHWVEQETKDEHGEDTALRLVVVGGEKAEWRHFDQWRSSWPGCSCQWLNAYGPTETTVYSTSLLADENYKPNTNEMPIGRPISNSEIYILDSHQRPVPIGVAGEIYIGGAGVARGYLDRPDLTADRFVPNPFAVNGRMYKTGDLGRWRSDGHVEYLGRNDSQVKIRGFRIELGEIEARLSACAGVRDAVVIAREDVRGERHLVAYLVPKNGAQILAAEVHDQIATALPAYMIPSAFVQLEALPLAPTGKLDRKALPAPESGAYVARTYEQPIGEVETTLARIWADVLKLERVGRYDNFFELGGHSLLIVTLVERIRSALGIKIAVGDVFACPVLEGLARIVAGAEPGQQLEFPSVSRTTELPLSHAQQRLWFLAQIKGGSEAYHIPLGLRLSGDLNRDALRRALDRIVWRHEALRTSFQRVGEQTVQRIAAPDSGFALEEEQDLRERKDSAWELEQRMAEEAWRAFDLEHGPLVRGQLIRLGEQEHVLLITMHHIASDGWSMGILTQELSALYRAYCREEEDPLLPLTIQYANYAVWQREWLSGEIWRRQSEYWQGVLGGAPAMLELPTDRPRPVQQEHGGDVVELGLERELAEGLKALSRRHGMTLFMTVLAGWAVVLSRLSGQEEVVIGTPVANRGRVEIQKLIGFFVNMLGLRVAVSGTVAELLERVKGRVLKAQEHQDLPFEQVVELMRVPRSLSHAPIFQVILAWQDNDPGCLDLPGLTVSPVKVAYDSAKFDVELELGEAGEQISGRLRYATALFDCSTMERHAGYLGRVLRAMVAGEQVEVECIDLLSESERHQLLAEWNDTRREYPQDHCIHELFESQVERTPDAVAVVFEDVSLSYAELNRRANQLARYLVARGVKPDTLVAVCMERSVEMVVALLATLKAGGAYVPLDPDYPAERLKHMLQDCVPVVVMTQIKIPSLRGSRTDAVLLDGKVRDWEQMPVDNLQVQGLGLHARHLAYLIYTSGSTGRPKGVMVEHAAVVNRLRWMQDAYGLRSHEPVLQKTPFSFDVSVWEFFWTLQHGATLVIAKPQGHKDPAYLTDVIEQARITTLHFVPSMLQMFLEYGQPERCSSLRRLVCSGEALSAALADRCLAMLPEVSLHNLYGPTEAAVDVSYHDCATNQAGANGGVSIGRPIANTMLYVLDGQRKPVPVGVAGELYIGGVQLARGYLNRPDLTAERFLPDPHALEPQSRMYKTGDMARWLPCGEIEYLGRNDHQVKIRGFRIELGEIEAMLTAHPSVREAAVLAREDQPGEKRLVAYVTAAERDHGSALDMDVEGLRAHLAAVLPEYMVPAAYVVLPKLPLTPNGKLDRRMLPAPEAGAYLRREYETPVGEAEGALARIWAELLKIERVGRHDNFFELGGHSLIAIAMIERMRRAGFHLEVRSIFVSPTLKALADAASRDSQAAEVPDNRIPPGCTQITPAMLPLVDLTEIEIEHIVAGVEGGAANVQDIYPLAPLQGGILFHHQMQSQGDVYVTVRLNSFASRERFEIYARALQAVIDRHDILRTAFMWEGLPEPLQVVWRRAKLAVQEMRLSVADGDIDAQLRSRFDPAHYKLDVRRAPLLHLFLAEDKANNRWLALELMHHLIDDNTSLRLLEDELEMHLLGHTQQLPAPVPFRNYVALVRHGVSIEEHKAFFSGMLSDVDEPTTPFGLTDVKGDGSRIVETHQAIDRALERRMRSVARVEGVSVAILCHLAWAMVLARTSGREDVVFGSVMFGRTHGGEGANRALGMFINTLPLRIRVGDDPARTSLHKTNDLLSRIIRHEHAPLSLAQSCSGIRAPAPLFTSMLNYRRDAPEMGGFATRARSAQAWSGIELVFEQERTNYPLCLNLDDLGEEFSLNPQVDVSVDPQRVCALMSTALESLVSALEQGSIAAVRSLDVLPGEERTKLLADWNDTRKEHAMDACIHELVEAQAAAHPRATAVVCENLGLTYGELNCRANRLAHHLWKLGVKPDTLVAICMDRSLEMVTGILAILKAGGAYVPLDSAYPVERLDYIAQDSAPVVVLVHGNRALWNTGEIPVIDLEADAQAWAHEPSSNLGREGVGLEPRHLAYIIYTSGSTGMPKGVMVEHANVTRLLSATKQWFQFGREDVWTLFHSYAFDFSVWEMWGALAYGGRLVVIPQEMTRSPQDFYRLLCEERVTVLNQTPSAFSQLIAAQRGSTDEQCLRCVIFGGEELEVSKLKPWYQREDNRTTKLVNMYGITETTVHVTYRQLEEADTLRIGASPIGVRIPDLTLYILDPWRRPVPIGVEGELYVGGRGVTRGYLNRPELTAERFIADPFNQEPGMRLYKTGDIGRYRPDGEIEYLGRNDQQMKVRGFRIELGEIEARLAEYESVRDLVVLAREDQPGDKRLVAYVVTHTPEPLDVEALRKHLGERLPEYMIPAAYVQLEKLPLTPNGKLDRRALPSPAMSAYATRAYEAPVGEMECTLAHIWAEVLKLDRVGRHDNFFELGGHSLLAITVIERARRAGLQIEVRSLFAAPTLKDLAEVAGKEASALEVPPNLIPPGCTWITPGMLPLVELNENEIAAIVSTVQGGAANVQDIYPLAPLQAGMLFHHQLQAEGDVSLIEAVFGFDTRERFDRYAAALQAIIDRHDILRTAFVWEGLTEPVQVVWRHAALAIEEVELDAAKGDVAAQLRAYCNPRRRRIDLGQAPLWRLFIAEDVANKRWVVVELVHHLIDDNTTFRLLGTEFEAFLLGQAQYLPAPIPFRTFVAQARLGVSQSEHVAFFSEMLGGVDEPTMAFGLGDIQGDGSRIAEAEQHLGNVLSGRLRAVARAASVSAATLCHLAWAMVLARTSGRDDVTFGTIIFGRMQGSDGADRALGMFINLLPLRLQVGLASVYVSVRKTHELLSRLLRHEHAPLSLAQRCSGIRPPIPLFTATLNYRHSAPGPQSSETLRRSAQAWEGIEVLDGQERTNYPFNIYIDDFVDDITLTALVDKSLDPFRVCGLMRTALETLAGALEYSPESPLGSLDILSVAELRQVTIDFNAAVTTDSQGVCLHTLFEAQVARTPDTIALVDEAGLMTYGELNRRANQLARHLRTMGVVPDARVAICLERGPDMVVSMLATLKAGAGYVPLDPAYPVDRLAYMIDDSAPSVILTRAAASIGYTGSIPVLDVQADAAAWSGEAETDPGLEDVLPRHTAYVIYTSGSTGQPKGVVVEHANVVNLVHEYIELCSLAASDRILQFASYTFDASVEEIFPALSVGATIVLRPAHLAVPDVSFVDFLATHEVTIADLPTAFWHQWAGEVREERSKPDIPLRLVIVGGEKAELRHLINWFERCGNYNIRWLNTYGPTEATVNATSLCVDPAAVAQLDEIPIGRPVANARIYILDAHGQVAPVGVAGEIHVGGAGIARGYLGKPGLTSERFIPDTFAPKSGGRLYKTGDIGRWLPDGNVEYFGRNDFQVKIRGYRIELGEIESKIRNYPGVRSTVVIAREDTPGDKRLVAYVLPETGTTLSAATLRAHLAASLPAYMLPGAFVQLEALPLTPSGKLDRAALPVPEDDAYATREYEEPLSEVEIAIAQIWADLLDLDRVGRHDNFFELGGHSLLAVAVIERMRRAHLKAEVRALFSAPTPALLAGLTEEVTEVVL